MSKLNEQGQEIPDLTPIVIRVKNRKITQWDDVRAFIRNELSNAARDSGAETFEEANDFEMEDDPEPQSRWEYSADQEDEDRQVMLDQIAARQQRSSVSQGETDDPPPGGTPPAAPTPPPGKPGDSSPT